MSSVVSGTWGSFAADANISASTITTGSTATSAAIVTTGALAIELSIIATYGSGATNAIVYIIRSYDGTNYQNTSVDTPPNYLLPANPGGAVHWVMTVQAEDGAQFKIVIKNPDSNSMTSVTLYTRSLTGTIT
jgi:hypothetical protein